MKDSFSVFVLQIPYRQNLSLRSSFEVIIIIINKLTTISNNKPVIIIRDNEKGTCMLIDVAISGDRNVVKKEAEKILQYKEKYSSCGM